MITMKPETYGDITKQNIFNSQVKLNIESLETNILNIENTINSLNTTIENLKLSQLISPKQEIILFDDFISGNTQSSFGWQNSSGNSGTGGVDNGVSSVSNTGIYLLSTGTTSTGRHSLYNYPSLLFFGGGILTLTSLINIQTLSTSVERYKIWIGFGDLPVQSGDMVDGAYFEYDEAVSPNWRIKTSSNTIRTTETTSTPVTTGWVQLKIVATNTEKIEFFINEILVGTITTNIISNNGRSTGIIYKIEKTNGINARNFYLDYVYFHKLLNTPRL